MARRPTLEVEGVAYPNVYSVTYVLYTAKDETGRPSDRAHAGVITVIRESTADTTMASWAMNSAKPNWKGGKVIFRNPDDSVMKELTWTDGFITSYKETIPHVKESPDQQVYEEFQISCQTLSIADASIDNRWQE